MMMCMKMTGIVLCLAWAAAIPVPAGAAAAPAAPRPAVGGDRPRNPTYRGRIGMAVPKRKVSKSRTRARRRSHRRPGAIAQACSQCGEPQQPHRVCPSGGYYRGRQVITVEAE